jgi:hypothetical protein
MNSIANDNQEDYIKFLIEKKGADVNLVDACKNSAMHYWAMAEYDFNDKLLRTDL